MFNIKGGAVGSSEHQVKMEFKRVEPPYLTNYLLPEFEAILPRKSKLLKLKQYRGSDIGIEKYVTMNDKVYRKLVSLLANGFWNVGCVEKLKHFLAWIDCKHTCWRKYRFLLKRFRYRLSATISLIEKRKRWLHRRTPKDVWLQSDSEILMRLEETPWDECKHFFFPTEDETEKLVNSFQKVEPVKDDEFDDITDDNYEAGDFEDSTDDDESNSECTLDDEESDESDYENYHNDDSSVSNNGSF